MEGVQDERRQSKVIDKLGFVRAIPKLREIVRVRHIGFRDQLNLGGDLI